MIFQLEWSQKIRNSGLFFIYYKNSTTTGCLFKKFEDKNNWTLIGLAGPLIGLSWSLTRPEKIDFSAYLTQLIFIQNLFSFKNGKDFKPMPFLDYIGL